MDIDKLLLIGIIAACCLGPRRLATHPKQLAVFIRQARTRAESSKAQLEESTGVEIDWSDLDPRRYDPRSIIRDALLQSEETPGRTTGSPATNASPPTSVVPKD